MKDIYILGIESSCDDTSAAVLKNGVLLSNVTASQEVHKAYGGVVPELASRAHQQNVVPVVDQAIARAGIKKEDLSAVAFTRGPGLMGSLLVGVSFSKGFARSLNIPMIDVNHLQGHVMAHFIKESDDDHLISNSSNANRTFTTGPITKNQMPYRTVFRITRCMDVAVSIHLKFFSPTHALSRIPTLNL